MLFFSLTACSVWLNVITFSLTYGLAMIKKYLDLMLEFCKTECWNHLRVFKLV